MGIIMKDGHQYGIGGIERAEDVSYDNTESGMTATDVQGALDELSAGLASLDGKRIRTATYTVTTDGSGAAILPDTYVFGIQTGKRMLISVSIANTLKTCSNPGIASNGYPYVHVRNYDGSNCASIQVTLYVYYVQY